MAENSALDVSTWIKRLDPNFKDSIALYGLSCVFPYHQIRADEPLLRVIATIGSLLCMFFISMEKNYAPLSKNLVPSWVN